MFLSTLADCRHLENRPSPRSNAANPRPYGTEGRKKRFSNPTNVPFFLRTFLQTLLALFLLFLLPFALFSFFYFIIWFTSIFESLTLCCFHSALPSPISQGWWPSDQILIYGNKPTCSQGNIHCVWDPRMKNIFLPKISAIIQKEKSHKIKNLDANYIFPTTQSQMSRITFSERFDDWYVEKYGLWKKEGLSVCAVHITQIWEHEWAESEV